MVSDSTRAIILSRAKNRCEYCQLQQDDSPLATLHVEHVIPLKHGGGSELGNLALACIDCNLHKGPNLTGIDPETDEICRLFHPRENEWDEHFRWNGIHLVGRTAIGRTTIIVLDMNSDEQLELRMA